MTSQVIMKSFMQSTCSNNEFQFYDTTMNQTMDWRTKNFIQTIMLQLLTMPYVQKRVTKVSITHLW